MLSLWQYADVMKVLIVNTNEKSGGAAVAAGRLVEALNRSGVKAMMAVMNKETDRFTVVSTQSAMQRKKNFLVERLGIFLRLHFSKTHLFDIDTASHGCDITSLKEFKEADIIHLHWINQGMLSLSNIRRILDSGKRVVWTMHDIWPATSLCHVTLDCTNFHTACRNCRLLPGGGSDSDLSAKVWKRKQKMLDGRKITFVTCSRWLASEAEKSALLTGQTITTVPNPIDNRAFAPHDKKKARMSAGLPTDKKLILFAAQRVTNKYKGMDYLINACRQMAEKHPEMLKDTAVVILGGSADELSTEFSFPVYTIGYISDEKKMAELYNAADVFVLPSLSENLPNTIMEAMSCGVPCVGFNVGGIPEEIDHKQNGYVAEYRSADDLAAGIAWVLCESDYDSLSRNAVSKVASHYSQQAVAMKYIGVYEKALKNIKS